MEFKIYLPDDVTGKCVYVMNGDVIRVYDESNPELETNVSYTDYYINSHYLIKNGNQFLENDIDCLSNDLITNNYLYRNDISSILIMLFFFLFIFYYLVKSCLKLFFRRVK